MSTETYAPTDSELDEFGVYRAVSKAAIFSVAFAVLSILFLFSAGLLVFPIAGIVCAIVALRNIKRLPHELTGNIPALLGIVACTGLLAAGSAIHTVTYVTEVPDGFERVSFYDLQPDNPAIQIPQAAKDLDGKRIFVKGYVHPSVQGVGPVASFILVPDMKTCCFGGQPKLTDMIEVKLPPEMAIAYTRTKRKLAGVFRVDTQIKEVNGMEGGYYTLEAEYVK